MNLKRLLRPILLLFLLLPLLFALFRFLNIRLNPALAAWFNDSWHYRKAIQVSNPSGGELTNYQVSFTLDTATLITAGKLQSGCQDIRIVDQNGNKLPYWIEDGGVGACNTATTNIWTKIPSIPTSGGAIYVYYGNTTAASTASGANTFDFFDTFPGAALDGTKWSTVGSPTVAGGSATLTNGAGIASLSTVSDASGVGKLIFRAKQAVTSLTGGKIGFSNTSNLATHFNTDQAAMLNLGSTEETVSSIGGTNLVSHHQLEETVTTDANQFKASGYLDTGKLGQAVSIYGNAARTDGSTLTFNRGASISGINYEHFNAYQGTISFWFKPSWDGTDGKNHFLFTAPNISGADSVYVSKTTTNNQIQFHVSNLGTANLSSVTITNGSWYHVVGYWKTGASGTGYMYIVVNGTTSANGWGGAALASVGNTIFIGSYLDNTLERANALIDDFAIYDRVLTTAEITSLYGGGTTPVEAGSVADPSLKFYAKMDGAGTLAPVTYNLGASASKLQAASSELTGGTNIVTNGNMESASSGLATGWLKQGSGTTTAEDAESANTLFDTRSQKLTTSGYTSQGIYYGTDIDVTAGDTYIASGWVKSDGTNYARFIPFDITNGGTIEVYSITNSSSWTYFQSVFKIPAGCLKLRIFFETNVTGSHVWYLDNISITKSLVDNGGMEGGANPPAGWTQETNATVTSDTSPHSGTNELKVVAGADNVGAKQSFTLVSGNYYLVTVWTRVTPGSTASILVDTGAGSGLWVGAATGVTPTTYTKYSRIFKAEGTAGKIYIRAAANTYTVWFDDVSVIPLDNVAGSLKAWTPVTDSSANTNSLSVQGGAAGVASNATGARGNAYTFDGSTGYLRQKTYATNIGDLSYLGNDTTTAELSDTGQTFTGYATGSGTAYAYMIVVTNSDNTTSWGYLGASDTAAHINIHTAKGSATRGWNGTAPVAGTKTPVGYEVRKTDFQITGNLTVGAWINPTSTAIGPYAIISHRHSGGNGYLLRLSSGSGVPTFYGHTGSASGTAVSSGQWSFVVASFDGNNATVYVNGQAGTPGAVTLVDGYSQLTVGVWHQADQGTYTQQFNGSIDSPFVISSALTADQIKDIYNSTASHYGLVTNLAGVNTQPANSGTPTTDANVYHTYSLTNTASSSWLVQDLSTFATSTTTLPNSAQYLRLQNTDVANALTVDWVAVAKSASSIPASTVSVTEEKGGGPIAYWKLDEGVGNTANDSSGQNNTGTLTGTTWSTEDLCVSGKCLKFNGTSDLVTVANTINNVQTVEFWVRPTTNTASMLQLSSTATVTASSGTISAGAGFTGPVIYVNGKTGTTLTANAWNHIVVTSTAGITSDAIKIGKSGAAYTTGFIDDVKIFSYARTAAQIKLDYNAGKAGTATSKGTNVSLGGSGQGTGGVAGSLSNGLVGYWKMEENVSGNNQTLVDSSGNANSATTKNGANGTGMDCTTVGKFNKGCTLDGVDDYVTRADGGSSDPLRLNASNFTLSTWINPTGTQTALKGIITKGGNLNGYLLRFGNSNFVSATIGNGATFQTFPTTSSLTAGSWNHLVFTYSGNGYAFYINGVPAGSGATTLGPMADIARDLYIGEDEGVAGRYFNGTIDETRIYNRALSQAEVTALYNWGAPPSAYWNLDEKTGLTANDTSTNGNTGTLNSASQAVISALSPTWKSGRYGSAVLFNGLDQYISAPSSTSLTQTGSLSLSAQIKPSSVIANGSVAIPGGVIASKGKNYNLSINTDPNAPTTLNSHSAFTTSSITTQLNGTNINDIYFYDTTKDTNYGDGTANDPLVWRFDSTKSWYTETIDHPARTCDIVNDDRCVSKEFPEKSYIVATASNVYIFDAAENAMWMRFVVSLGGTGNILWLAPTSIFALNGEIYVGTYNSGALGGSGIVTINFPADTGLKRGNNQTQYNGLYAGNISQRNSTLGFGGAGALTLVSSLINDVHAAVISGSTYVAVATDGGVSVINETAGTVVNSASTTAKSKVIISNRLYVSDSNSSCLRYTTSNANLLGAGFATSFYCALSTIPSTSATNNQLNNLHVTTGTSTIDGTSNTIYLGMNSGGVTVLQEKQGDESNGSVKYLTKDYISEEQIGDIRNNMSFNGTLSSSISNLTDLSDVSAKATTLTSSNANGTGMAYSAGVRGTSITFDGTDDYLKQKVYYDQTGATFGPTVHGLNLSTTAAFYRAQGRDLSTYHGTDGSSTPYMLVLKDSANKTSWGYIGSTDAAEALGTSELIANGTFDADTANWTANNATLTSVAGGQSNNALQVQNVGANYSYASQSFSTTAGKLYKLTFYHKNGTNSGNVYVGTTLGGGQTFSTSFSDVNWALKTYYFTSTTAILYLRLGVTNNADGNNTLFDEVSIKEVTDVGVDGVHIVSTRNGGTRTWAGIESGFNYNDTAYTFEVRKTDFQITGNLTVGAWIKISVPVSNGGIIVKENDASSANGFRFQTNASNKLQARINTGTALAGNIALSTGTWYFTTAVYDGTNLNLYVNGQLDTSGARSAPVDDPASFAIGARTNISGGSDVKFNGTIDEPFVTASALTANEIKRMYEVGKRALTAQGTNALNGTSNQVNAVVATGLSRRVIASGSEAISTAKLFAGTEGGGVSEIDLNSDTLVNSYSTGTTPAINHANVNALAVSPGGNFLAALDSGLSRLDDVSGRSNLSYTTYTYLSGLFDKDTGYYKLYENGILVGQTYVGTSYSPVANTDPLVTGAYKLYNTYNTYNFYGIIDDLILYPYARTAAQVVSDMNGLHSINVLVLRAGGRLGSALAYYKFDEGYGTTANNAGSGGSALNGTITNMASPATATSGWTNSGKFGKALVFDGSDDYVNVNYSTALSFPNNEFTISMWIKLNGSNTDKKILSQYLDANNRWYLGITASGYIYFYSIVQGSGGSTVTGTTNLQDNNWHLVTIRSEGANSIKAYIDGKLNASGSASSVNLTIPAPLHIGNYSTSLYFNGSIDEVKIYPFALTADEVKIDYNKGVAMVLGNVGTVSSAPTTPSNSAAASYCVPGDSTSCAAPVAEWKFDEKTGQYAYDTSGNANTGTLGTGATPDTSDPTWSQGKFGEALKFDGTADYVSKADFVMPSTGTISYWAKSNTSTWNNYGLPLSKRDDFIIHSNSGVTTLNLYTSGASYLGFVTPSVPINQWNYYTWTLNGSQSLFYMNGILISTINTSNLWGTSTSTLYFGKDGVYSRYFNGSLDQVRVFNYARTPAQIAWDYNQGDPVAWYKMDECQGTTLHSTNDSGQARMTTNDGTLTIGATVPQTSAGTCSDGLATSAWYNGRSGAPLSSSGSTGGSINFDGADDYASTSNVALLASNAQTYTNVSWGGWVYPTTTILSKTMVHKNNEFRLTTTAGGIPQCEIYSASWQTAAPSAAALPLATWSHVLCVYNGVNITVYVNGKASGTPASQTANITSSSATALSIARDPAATGYFSGQLDDVKIFNYALTATQIKTLYNGAAVRFGN